MGRADRREGTTDESDRWDARLTEARNPRTQEIDRASAPRIVELILDEDLEVPAAVARQAASIADLIERVAARLSRGGRLFYLGAGTSGRLGVLDAAECPPTFGTDPELVQGIIAGGPDALIRSREGVEDGENAARSDVTSAGVVRPDFVLGIATSGTTPYVLAGLDEAAARGAEVGFLSCTEPPEPIRELADVLITPLVGPEVIAGSTRLKAGTATKLVLNILTTGVMIRLGKVYQNLMVDLRAASRKLVDRSLRIVEHLCEVERERARGLLVASGGSVKTALAMELRGVDRGVAERLLDACDGSLGELLDRFPVGVPYPLYAGYPEPNEPGELDRLIRRLAEAVERLRDAAAEATRAGGSQRSPRSGAWAAPEHVAHLLEFERTAVGPRVRAFAESAPDGFDDWQPTDPPPDARLPLDRLLAELDEERRRTLETVTPPDRAVFDRTVRLGGEEFTLFQFLRGVAQHDGAHATRIAERVHPALLDPPLSERPVT